MWLALAYPLSLWAQFGSQPVSVAPPARVVVATGETVPAKVKFQLAPGYHTNSNKPSDEYLIPLRLTWEAAPLEVGGIDYPAGHLERYSFADKPLSVYTGDFEIVTRLKAPANAPKGSREITGKLRYQACTTTTCLPPKTLTFRLPVEIR